MAAIEIGALSDRLSEEEIAQLSAALERLGAPTLPRPEEDLSVSLDNNLDDDAVTEFFDYLDAHDIAAEIYLPMEFEGRVEVTKYRVGSLVTLIEALGEIKHEIDLAHEDELAEDEEDDDDLEDENIGRAGERVRRCWMLFHEGAQTAYEKQLPLYVSL